jgi:hypothetical protein
MRTPDVVFRYLGQSERIRQRAFQPHMIEVAPLKRSRRPSTSFILRFMRLCLSLEKNLDSICSPHRDASTEKIRIFGPHRTSQSECCGEYWPITFVSIAQPLPGFAFKDGIKFWSNHLDDVSQVFERCRKVGVGLPGFFKRAGKYFSASSKATSGAKKRTP